MSRDPIGERGGVAVMEAFVNSPITLIDTDGLAVTVGGPKQNCLGAAMTGSTTGFFEPDLNRSLKDSIEGAGLGWKCTVERSPGDCKKERENEELLLATNWVPPTRKREEWRLDAQGNMRRREWDAPNQQPARNRGRCPYTDPAYWYGATKEEGVPGLLLEDFHGIRCDSRSNKWKCIGGEGEKAPDGTYPYAFHEYDPVQEGTLFDHKVLCCRRCAPSGGTTASGTPARR